MKKTWYHLGRTLDRRAEADLKGLKIPFRKRIDVVLLFLFFSVIFLFVAWWLIGVVLGQRFGIFDGPGIQPVSDPRILANIRDNIEENPLLDAVLHLPEGCIYFSQQGGGLHRYDPSTGLWSTETTFSGDENQPRLLNPDLILLRSGCGTDPLSNRIDECEDSESLWGLTSGGGLVRRGKGKWEILKSDSEFTGSRGLPVERGQLTAAAVSGDKQWLVVGTRQDGIGIYHLKSRHWLQLEDTFYKNLPSAEVSHIAWGLDRFWIGGPAGLASLELQKQTPLLAVRSEVNGKIMDMDVDTVGGVWVLEKRNCRNGGFNCLGLYRFQGPRRGPALLMDEGYLFPKLTLEDFHFARYWERDHRLIAAGSGGVFSYDARAHSWARHFRGRISAVLSFPGERGEEFYFGFRGGIGIVSRSSRPWRKPNKRCTSIPLPDLFSNEKISKLHHGQKDEVLALTQSGSLFALKDEKVHTVFTADTVTMDPMNFRTAVAFGDNVLFIGDKKAVIHNIVTRGYREVSVSQLPEWLRWPELQMVNSGGYVYIAAGKKGDTGIHIYSLPLRAARAADFKSAVMLSKIPGPVTRLRDWGGKGACLVAGSGDGRVLRFSGIVEPLTGLKAQGVGGFPLLDAAPFRDGIITATPEGLRYYDYQVRTWSTYKSFYGAPPREVVQCGGRLFMSTLQGRLMELTFTDSFNSRIGGERGFNMSDNQLSDVMAKYEKLYLAGNGRINCYNTDLRQIAVRWNLPVKGDIFITGIVSGRPLALSSGMAFLGNNILDADAGRVLNISIGKDYIWTVRQKGRTGNKYLKGYPIAGPLSLSNARCFFYNPYAGPGTRTGKIFDAVELPNGVLAVSFDKGPGFYNPVNRSWYPRVQGAPLPRGGRLYVLGRHLVTAAEREDQKDFIVTTVDTGTIQLPPGCSDDAGAVVINGKSLVVQAYTLAPRQGLMAFVEKNGAVTQWQGGMVINILPPPGEAPPVHTLTRVFHRQPGFLLFTSNEDIQHIQRYDLKKRTWWKTRLNISPDNDPLKEIDLAHDSRSNREIITAKTEQGKFYLGEIPSPASAAAVNGVKMRQVYQPGAGFGHPAEDLVDVQDRGGGAWTFVLKDRIKYYNPVSRRWWRDVEIPGLSGVPLFCRTANLGVIAASGGRTWWVGRGKGPHPMSFARYDLRPGETTAVDNNGAIWRLLPDGTLFRLKQPPRGDYREQEIAFERPFLLNPAAVNRAFEWGDWVIFDTGGGIRMLHRILRQEIPLTEPARSLLGIEEILGEGGRLWIRTGTGRLLLLTPAKDDPAAALQSKVFPGTISTLVEEVEELKGETFSSSPLLADRWDQLKQKVIGLPNGGRAYDPIVRLAIGSDNQLLAQRPGGQDMLAQSGAIDIDTPPPPLDAGWLRWNRENKTFAVKTPSAEKTMKPAGFIKDGKLIFEEIDALLTVDSNRLHAANRYGIWNHTGGSLSLNDTGITFRPVDWTGPTAAAHGRFITAGRIYTGDGKPLPQSQQTHRVSFGDVTLSEHLRRTGIEGRIKGGNDAFADKGFTWDRNKRGLAYIGSGSALRLSVHSDAGIHPVNEYTGFETVPGRGRLYSPRAGGLYFRSGGSWFRRTGPSKWQTTALDPTTNRLLVDNGAWKWQLRNGGLRIDLKGGKSYGFKAVSGSAGFGFTSDMLSDAAVFDNHLYVETAAFLEIADPPDQLVQLRAPRRNNTAKTFEKLKRTNAPGRKGLLVNIPKDNPRLRFTRLPSGRLKKEVKVIDIAGKVSWQEFQLWNNRFPFDVVTSIAANKEKRHLYVGTRAGLQVYSGNLTTALNHMDVFYRLRGRGGEPLAVVEKVGIPAGGGQDVVVAYSSGQCIEKPPGGTFRLCGGSGPGRLKRRLRHEDHFWRFVESGGRLEGRYKAENKTFSSRVIPIRDGRFPHDRIKDIAIYDGFVFTLWHNGWISRQPARSMELTKDMINYDTQSIAPRRFIEVQQDMAFIKSTAARGLYAAGRRGQRRLWRYSPAPAASASSPWKEITDPEIVNGLLQYADRPPVVNRQRLRLLSSRPGKGAPAYGAEPFIFQQRTLAGGWRPLAWEGGCVGIDRWSEFLYLDGRLWAATPCGLVSFSRLPGERGRPGRVALDPDDFIVIPGPEMENKIPRVTDMEAEKNIVTIRCDTDSEKVFQGTITGQDDRDVFARLEGGDKDPFAKKIQVSGQESGFWEWVREDCKDYSTGKLKGRLRGEEIQLVGGRFGFDSINSIAFFQEQEQAQKQDRDRDRDGEQNRNGKKRVTIVEIGTDFNGWYRAVGGRFHAADFLRPGVPGVNPTVVKEVRTTLGEGGGRILGLRTAGQGFIRLGKKGISGQTSRFPQYLGSDGFWRYLGEDGGSGGKGLSITAAGSAGSAKRDMENGRFTDDIVLGLPVSAADEKGIYYLVPTRAGVLRLDHKLNPADIYPKESLKSPDGTAAAAPSVLFIDHRSGAGKALYLAQNQLPPLPLPAPPPTGGPGSYLKLQVHVPEDAVVLAVEEGPQDFVRVRWQKEQQRGWSLLNPGSSRVEESNVLYVNLRKFGKFQGGREKWEKPGFEPWMRVRIFPGRIEFLLHGSDRPHRMNLPEPLNLLSAVVTGDRLLLIGKTTLWKINPAARGLF